MRDSTQEPSRQLIVIDLLSYSSSHLSVNSFWLAEVRRNLDFEFVAEAEHFEALERLMRQDLPGKKIRKERFWRLSREFIFASTLWKNRNQPLMVLGATGVQILFLSGLERIMPRWAQRWLVILHSEVEGVVSGQGVMKRIAGLALRRLGFPRNCQCIVLGCHIKKNLDRIGLANPRIECTEHPLPETHIPPLTPIAGGRVRIAMIGLLRGDNKDFDVAERIAQDPRTTVYAIGRKGPSYVPHRGIVENLVSSHYSNDWMMAQLAQIDALLLCPHKLMYKYTALGSVADALTYGKTLAWIRHDALAAYEDAPIAVCADTPEELISKLGSFSPPTSAAVQAWTVGWGDKIRTQLWRAIRKIMEPTI